MSWGKRRGARFKWRRERERERDGPKACFQVHLHSPGSGALLFLCMVAHVTGETFFVQSRRRVKTRGAVLATLRIKHVLAWWTRFDATPRASQACTSGDVEVVAQNDGQ